MKIEIRIEKRHVVYLVLTMAILVGINYVIAQIPDPGHPWSRIECSDCITAAHIGSIGACSNICTDANTITTDTNAKTLCGNNQYLRGDGSTVCRTASQIVSDGGGYMCGTYTSNLPVYPATGCATAAGCPSGTTMKTIFAADGTWLYACYEN